MCVRKCVCTCVCIGVGVIVVVFVCVGVLVGVYVSRSRCVCVCMFSRNNHYACSPRSMEGIICNTISYDRPKLEHCW